MKNSRFMLFVNMRCLLFSPHETKSTEREKKIEIDLHKTICAKKLLRHIFAYKLLGESRASTKVK